MLDYIMQQRRARDARPGRSDPARPPAAFVDHVAQPSIFDRHQLTFIIYE